MKRILPLLALLALPAAGALPHPASYEFDYGAKFTVSGYAAGKPTLSGFPVLVRIQNGSPSGFSYDDLQSKSTGADIAFVDMSGNGLPFEIDTWNPSGTSLIWVRLPSMQNGTEFVMCWGSATSGKTVCGTNPWSDYVGVWHMSEASGTVADATGHGLGAEPAGATQYSVGVSGKIGGARQNSTAQSGRVYLLVPNYNDRGVGSAFTVSGWFNSKGVPSSDMRLFSRKYKYTDSGGWEVLVKESGKSPKVRGGTNAKQVEGTFNPVLKDTGWQFVTFVFDGTTAATFQNDIQLSSGEIVAATDNGQPLGIGSYGGGTESGSFFIGDMDEARLRPGTVTADWIAADYATQNDASFLTAGVAEIWREKPDPAAELSVGSVQISNAVATVSVSRLGAEASYVDVTVSVSADAGFATTAWTTTYRVTGEDSRNLAVTGLEPFTTYYARAVVSNNKGKSATTAAVSFKTKKAPRAQGDKIVEGLEDYGALTLVDEIDCSLSLADDPDHMFREYPAGWSTVEDILDVPTRVMHHKSDTCCYVSWRVGKGKGIVPNEPYVLVVDYPDEAPRSVTVFNFGNATRHGYHTGWTAGDSWSPPYVTQSLESWAIPYSGETKQLVQVMVPFEKSKQYNGSDSRIYMDTDGFDLNFGIIKAGEAPDSVGLAVSAIRLYKIDNYAAALPTINYPAGDVPRRIVTSREEMGDSDDFAGFSDPPDFYKGRAKMIRLLGMNTCSKDLLEFGYQQNWDPKGSGWLWGSAADYWTKIVKYLGEEDVYILPFYEYHGSRGSNGMGYDDSLKPWTLNSAKNADWKWLFSNQKYVYGCMADLANTDRVTRDLKSLFDITIKPYTDKATFLGMWLRNRGGMPMGFNDYDISEFNRKTGRSVTRADIYNNGNYYGTELYNAYREWWYGRRRDLFSGVHSYIAGQLPGARLYYSNTIEEPGEFWANWKNPRPAVLSNEAGYTYQGKNFNQFTGKNWSTDFATAATNYGPQALFADGPTWGNYEVNHSAVADDPEHYRDLTGVALCYPFNTVWSVAGGHAAKYRTAGGDLPFVRHYSLNENDFRNANNSEICGYYTCDWDHAGRAVVLSELYAMAYDDPTMLAYLFTANLVRNDSTYVREFNLEFLSLPALPSEILRGGAWPATLTVRRWTTASGNYWAVINCDSKDWSGQVDFQTDAGTVWRTVDGTPLPLSGGKAVLSLEPFQMRCFTDIEPELVRAPVVRFAYASDIAAKAATIAATVSDLGSGSIWADVSWVLSSEGVPCAASGSFARFSGPDTHTVRVPGLEAGTVYTATYTARGSNGETSTCSFTFKTAPWPYAFSGLKAVTDGTATHATLSVRVAEAKYPARLVLVADGETVRTWDSVVPGQVFSATIDITPASVTRFSFVLAEKSTGDYETAASGVVLGRKTLGFIDIAFDRSQYAGWELPEEQGVDPVDGGTWFLGGEENGSLFQTDGGDRRIGLATSDDGYVRYGAGEPSDAGRKVRVEGRARLLAETGAPDEPVTAPLAALALGKIDGTTILYGYTKGGWVPFDGFRVPSDGWIDWAADIDFGAKTVSYEANETVLATNGVSRLDLAGAQTRVSRVSYSGMGEVDDFRGVYYEEEKLAEFDARIGTNRLTSLVFKAQGEPNAGDFAIEVEDAVEGLWYAAFGSESLSVPVTNWTCVACAQAQGGTVELDADPFDKNGQPLASQFFVVCGATERIEDGVRLGDVMPQD